MLSKSFIGDSLFRLVKNAAGVGVDEDVFALGFKSFVEVGLAVQLGVGRHLGD